MLLALALVLVPLSLLGVQVLIRGEFNEVRELRATAEETVVTRDELAQLLALHLDAETAVRGYVITGDRRFLAPYEAAVPRRDALFSSLRDAAGSEVDARLDRLLVLSDAKLANASMNLADMRAGQPEAARARIAEGRGKLSLIHI